MFLIFAGDSYYPGGGWRDFKGYAPTLEAALEIVANQSCDWWHVSNGHEIVKSGGRL